MKRNILWLLGVLMTVSFAVSACEETDGTVDPYQDWEERNARYIDSIASVARANQGEAVGQWKIIHTYKYPQQGITMGDVDEYVYCKVLEVGNGEVSPLFTDTVGVHYQGRLIPLYNGKTVTFDQSYYGELDKGVAMPFYSPSVDSYGNSYDLGTGMKTATMEMRVGDRWEVYVPYQLGYGTDDSGSIPGYSTLIFDWYLSEIRPLKGNPQD